VYANESANGTRYNNAPYPGHSATGPMQIIPSTWAMYAKPGERIDNPADNMRVGRRILAALWAKYHGDIDKVLYSYANGSPDAPDLNPGYVAKARRYMDSHPATSSANDNRRDPRIAFIPPGTSAADAATIVQRAVAGWKGGTGDQSTNFSTGDIHVHTTADSATGIAAATVLAAQGADYVTQSNGAYKS